MTFRPNDFLKTIVSSFSPFTSDFVPIFYSFYYFITRKDVVLHEGNSKPPPPSRSLLFPSFCFDISSRKPNGIIDHWKQVRDLSTDGGTKPQRVFVCTMVVEHVGKKFGEKQLLC